MNARRNSSSPRIVSEFKNGSENRESIPLLSSSNPRKKLKLSNSTKSDFVAPLESDNEDEDSLYNAVQKQKFQSKSIECDGSIESSLDSDTESGEIELLESEDCTSDSNSTNNTGRMDLSEETIPIPSLPPAKCDLTWCKVDLSRPVIDAGLPVSESDLFRDWEDKKYMVLSRYPLRNVPKIEIHIGVVHFKLSDEIPVLDQSRRVDL
jgi:hypothetical protein